MRSSRWSSPEHSARRTTLALGAVLFGVYAATLGTHAVPGHRITAAGAHVLLTTRSIADDRDLDLRNQYRERAWRSYYGGELKPTARPGAGGRIAEPQGVGLPLLLAPAWAIGGVTAVRLWLALLAAAAFACAASLARRLVPEPWASASALAVGLSPPVVAASTTIRPEIPAAAALAGGAVLALRIRDRPEAAVAFWAALLVAAVPWLGLTAVAPAAVVALALTRWLRRRQRGLAGFVALEVVFTSAVVFITINDRLYGGLTPYALRARPGPATGLHDADDLLARIPRVFELLGQLWWAPFTALGLAGLWLLWRSRHTRLASAIAEHVHVEVVAAFAALAIIAQVLEAGLLAPRISGPWFTGRLLVPALPFAAALAAWGLRRFPRVGSLLAAATVGLTVWTLIAALFGDATLAPPHGIF
jgi:hypothetical protein